MGDVLHVHIPPDPVNVRNGNFYLPIQDYYLSCFGFPLEVYRSYNSLSTRNGPFGHGWTFNYDLQIAVGEKNGMEVVEADGFLNLYTPVEAEGAKKKGAKTSKSGKYISRSRGMSTLEKTASGYIRTTESGRREEYNGKGLLVRLVDRNSNELNFSYDLQSHLDRVADGCNQWLKFNFNNRGKITEITDSVGRKLSYTYDDRDLLTSALGLDKETTKFTYDKLDRMATVTFNDGTKTEITYDPKTGYVSKQSGPGTKVTTYKYGKEGKKTWALIEDNEGLKNRYDYNDPDNQITFTDKSGKKTVTTVNACCGKPVSIKDEKGIGEEFRYDVNGNLTERTDSLKRKTKIKYEPRFHLPEEITESDGTSMRFVYDKNGNLTFAKSKEQSIKLIYEAHGKIDQMTDQRENVIRFTYTSFGKPLRIEKKVKDKFIGAINVKYDKNGEISEEEGVTYEPKNPETVQDIRNTLTSFLRLLKPTGIDFEI